MDKFKQHEAAWIALNQSQRSIYMRIDKALVDAGLPRQKWYDVLWSLETAPDGLRPFQLEQLLLFDQSSFSRQVARMTEEGLIEQRRCPKDGRGKTLHLTDKGKDLRKRMWDIYRPMIDKGVGDAHAEGLFEAIQELG